MGYFQSKFNKVRYLAIVNKKIGLAKIKISKTHRDRSLYGKTSMV